MSHQSLFPSEAPRVLTPGQGPCVLNFLSQVELQILSIPHPPPQPLTSLDLLCEELDASEHHTITLGRHQVTAPYCLYEAILSMREGERRLIPLTFNEKLDSMQVFNPVKTQRTTHSYIALHLVSFIRAVGLHEMTADDLLDEASKQKSIGNEFFLAQNRTNAAYHYSTAAMLCVLANTQEQSDRLKGICLLNLAACWLHFREFERAKDATQKMLNSDPSNEKALYRQGVALSGLGDWEAAAARLTRVVEINPRNQEAVQELKSVRVQCKDIQKKEREKYSKLFS